MNNLILVRHGQSEWNLENRFTGWVDVDLTPKGKLEACKAGELIKEQKISFDNCFTSFQKRAINTLELILNTLRIKDNETIKAWQLNERHYGSLTGLNKDEMKKKLGEKKELLGAESQVNFLHVSTLDIYKKLSKKILNFK